MFACEWLQYKRPCFECCCAELGVAILQARRLRTTSPFRASSNKFDSWRAYSLGFLFVGLVVRRACSASGLLCGLTFRVLALRVQDARCVGSAQISWGWGRRVLGETLQLWQ